MLTRYNFLPRGIHLWRRRADIRGVAGFNVELMRLVVRQAGLELVRLADRRYLLFDRLCDAAS